MTPLTSCAPFRLPRFYACRSILSLGRGHRRSQVPRCFRFQSCHVLRPRRGLRQPSPRLAVAYYSLPYCKLCRPSVFQPLRGSFTSALAYGLIVALSTLNSCRYLHKPKTRFQVSGLLSFQGGNLTR